VPEICFGRPIEDRLRVMRKCVGSDDAAEDDDEAVVEDEDAWEEAEGGAAFRSRAWSAVKYRTEGFQVARAERILVALRRAEVDLETDILRKAIGCLRG
jgi:hypothetical protein